MCSVGLLVWVFHDVSICFWFSALAIRTTWGAPRDVDVCSGAKIIRNLILSRSKGVPHLEDRAVHLLLTLGSVQPCLIASHEEADPKRPPLFSVGRSPCGGSVAGADNRVGAARSAPQEREPDPAEDSGRGSGPTGQPQLRRQMDKPRKTEAAQEIRD